MTKNATHEPPVNGRHVLHTALTPPPAGMSCTACNSDVVHDFVDGVLVCIELQHTADCEWLAQRTTQP